MVSVTRMVQNIEITAEGLQGELDRLQVQKQALERELAAVVAHLSSVQQALSALETLMSGPAVEASTNAVDATVGKQGRAGTHGAAQLGSASRESADTVANSSPETPGPVSGRPLAVGADTSGREKYGKLTEQIMDYFARVGDVDVRARDVAAALGRDADSGTINGVRSTLDRLVGTSRILRSGRGLYRAKSS